jgi:aldose 1-epimerase
MLNPIPYGDLDGRPVMAVSLSAGNLRARVISFGARLTELWLPGRDGAMADVVLGLDTLDDYRATPTYFGATCGRYGNRIRDGRFTLDGADIQVDRNEGDNHLHGGAQGFDRKVWDIAGLTGSRVVFTAVSDAGEMGYPGRLALRTAYDLTPDGLTIEMTAETDATTVINMVHHSYFNLAGQGSGDVLGQMLRVDAPFYTPVGAGLLPTGEVLAVAGTPFDFTKAKRIGRDLGDRAHQAALGMGYDHNWCLGGRGYPRACATAWDPASGRKFVLTTTEPGVQLYTGGYLTDSMAGKAGARLCQYAGFTLETQKFPDSLNRPHFPDCRLHPGQVYRHLMHFRFGRCDEDGDDL